MKTSSSCNPVVIKKLIDAGLDGMRDYARGNAVTSAEVINALLNMAVYGLKACCADPKLTPEQRKFNQGEARNLLQQLILTETTSDLRMM